MNFDASPRAPFPWFGGKSRVARVVWDRFGSGVSSYVEPFFGSGAVLLGRPGRTPAKPWVETVNDIDGFVANAWRAIRSAPEETAEYADWPVNEVDLHARHAWLAERRSALQERLMGDPEWFDAKIAGWWLWGVSCWIGGGFCSGSGPWVRENIGSESEQDWRFVRKGAGGSGAQKRRIHLGNGGMGVNRKLVHLGDGGRGVNRKLVHLGGAGSSGPKTEGRDSSSQGIVEWFTALSKRLSGVRVCCGDWLRVVGSDAALMLRKEHSGKAAIFFDPPYSSAANRDPDIYAMDSGDVARDVRDWCIRNGAKTNLRIALCGYAGEGHEVLESLGWSRHNWNAIGGYSNQGNGAAKKNATREAIWFSPHCRAAPALSRFGGGSA